MLTTLALCVGDVIHLDVFGQPMIILGSHEAAIDLLEKRSANYSDRAQTPMTEMYVMAPSRLL